eukprot:320694-Chlamydomonas_euryale.AAC.1
MHRSPRRHRVRRLRTSSPVVVQLCRAPTVHVDAVAFAAGPWARGKNHVVPLAVRQVCQQLPAGGGLPGGGREGEDCCAGVAHASVLQGPCRGGSFSREEGVRDMHNCLFCLLLPTLTLISLCLLALLRELRRNGVGALDHTAVTILDHTAVTTLEHTGVDALDHTAVTTFEHTGVDALDHTAVTTLEHTGVDALDHTAVTTLDHTNGWSLINNCSWLFVLKEGRGQGGPLTLLPVSICTCWACLQGFAFRVRDCVKALAG